MPASTAHGGLGTRIHSMAVCEVAIRVRVEPIEDGRYVATSPDVPGLVAEGRSIVEVAKIAQELARRIFESCVEHGDPVPAALQPMRDSAHAMDLTVPVGVG